MVKRMHLSCVAGALMAAGMVLPGAASAAYTTIDFESVTFTDPTSGTTYTNVTAPIGNQLPHPDGVGIVDNGFTYDPGPQVGADPYDLHIANQVTAVSGGLMYPYNGTTIAGAHHSSILARADGGSFTLYGFDYAGYVLNGSTYEVPVLVTGTLAGGGTVSQTFSPDSIVDGIGVNPDFQTFNIGQGESPWRNLVSVTFSIVDPQNITAATQGSFAVDNIGVSSVPEPASVLLFGAGMLGLAWLQRKSFRRG